MAKKTKPVKKKPASKKPKSKVRKSAGKTKAVAKKTAGKKIVAKKATKTRARARTAPKKKTRTKPTFVGLEAAEPRVNRRRSNIRAGDLEGLSRVEGADSESISELLDEGNAFEAEAVSGVEAADLGTGEVRTHEVPEDDVPDEYLDNE
jgi:hypothetical protein